MRHGFTEPRRLRSIAPGCAAIRRITASVTPVRIELARPRLEDIFISLVSEGNVPAPSLLAALRDGSAGATA